MDKPILSKQAFWDVDMDKIDYEKHALYVMENVMNHGTMDDLVALSAFYGDKKIRETIIHSKELGPKEINFCCVIFELNSEDFKYPPVKLVYPNYAYYGA